MARLKRDPSEMESWLALRDDEGLTLREMANRSGIPFGTIAFWSNKRRRSAHGVGFVEARLREPSKLLLAPDAASLLLRFSSGGVIELRGELAERMAVKLLAQVAQWS